MTIKDGIIAVGKGERTFHLLDDLPKIDNDINYLKQKYLKSIPHLDLSFV